MVILADATCWMTLQETSSLSVNLNKFLDLILQSFGFGRRARRIFRHEMFTHAVLISFYLEISQCVIGSGGQPSDPVSESLDVP